MHVNCVAIRFRPLLLCASFCAPMVALDKSSTRLPALRRRTTQCCVENLKGAQTKPAASSLSFSLVGRQFCSGAYDADTFLHSALCRAPTYIPHPPYFLFLDNCRRASCLELVVLERVCTNIANNAAIATPSSGSKHYRNFQYDRLHNISDSFPD